METAEASDGAEDGSPDELHPSRETANNPIMAKIRGIFRIVFFIMDTLLSLPKR